MTAGFQVFNSSGGTIFDSANLSYRTLSISTITWTGSLPASSGSATYTITDAALAQGTPFVYVYDQQKCGLSATVSGTTITVTANGVNLASTDSTYLGSILYGVLSL